MAATTNTHRESGLSCELSFVWVPFMAREDTSSVLVMRGVIANGARAFSTIFLLRVLAAVLQLPQHVMDELGNLVLTEGVAIDRLLTDRAVRQPPRRLLHEVKHNGPFAVPDIFVANDRRTPAPRLPAPIRPANDPRIRARVDTLYGNVALAHCQVVFHEKIRIARI